MKFKNRNLRELAEMIIGDTDHFHYRSSSYITRFFEECDLDFVHDGSTRWSWTSSKLEEGSEPTALIGGPDFDDVWTAAKVHLCRDRQEPIEIDSIPPRQYLTPRMLIELGKKGSLAPR